MEIFANSTKSLYIRQLSDINSPPHIHNDDEIEIMIMLNGKSSCSINGINYTLNSNTFAIVTKYQTHSYYHTDNVNTLSFIFNKKFNKQLYYYFSNHIFNPPIIDISDSLDVIKPLFDTLLYELQIDTQYEELIYESYANISIMKLIRIIDDKNKSNNNTIVALKNSILFKAQDYCTENYTQELTVSDIAKNIGVHPNYLSSAFKNHFGVSIIHYLNICRLRHAISLMDNKKLSITEIAFASGFQSVRTFNRIFKNEMGESPKEFQKKLEGNPQNTYTII